jgi:hypothetical protein
MAVVTVPANTTYRVYYYAGGKPIAMRVMPPNDNTGTLYYLHADHLGSTSVTTNASAGVVARQWYYPYGAVRGSVGTLPITSDLQTESPAPRCPCRSRSRGAGRG